MGEQHNQPRLNLTGCGPQERGLRPHQHYRWEWERCHWGPRTYSGRTGTLLGNGEEEGKTVLVGQLVSGPKTWTQLNNTGVSRSAVDGS